MDTLRVRINEGEQKQPNLLWDTAWYPPAGIGDWALANADEQQNRGGLRAKAALQTAIILALFTDRRIPDRHPLKRFLSADADPRGWWGDGVDVRADLSEVEMGSLLWVFERSTLTEEVRRLVEAETLQALSPLIAQGVAARIEAQASAVPAVNRVDLAVQVYGRDGAVIYDHRFEDIWRQAAAPPKPKLFPPYPPAA